MFPVLISIGQFQLLTSSVLVAIASVLVVFLIWRKTREEHYEDDLVFDSLLLSIAVSLISGKLGAFLFSLPVNKWSDSSAIVSTFFQAGYSEHIGLLVGLTFFHWYILKLKWNSDEFLEYISPPLALFFFFQWIGRFFSGAYAGTTTNLPIGLQFPGVFDLRHPVQLYFAVGFLVLWLLLRYLEPRYRFFAWYRGKRQVVEPGFLFGVFLFGYGLICLLFSGFAVTSLLGELPLFVTQLLFLIVTMYGIWIIYSRSSFIVRKKKAALTKKGQASRSLLWLTRIKRVLKK